MGNRREKLLGFVKEMHGDQKRKYTGEPYYFHLLNVAAMAEPYHPLAYEVGLCHDLLEDTDVEPENLFNVLLWNEDGSKKYSPEEAHLIIATVIELSDVFTSEEFPYLNRAFRKEAEALRLHHVSPLAQTVKYCDLIDNTESIVANDPHFAGTYLREKHLTLKGMNKGDAGLYQIALRSLNRSIDKLKLEEV